ncbi:MAG: phosphopyruvate hydratase [Candidatus Paceibacterota bacterium]|jgi:enolase
MKAKDINVKIILDSRGEPTLEAEFFGENFSVFSSVPAGKSKGSHEMVSLEPEMCLEKFPSIKTQILEKDFSGQKEFDDFLIFLDGTKDKSNLGGNLILVLSLVFARAFARSQNVELYKYISALLSTSYQLPATNFPLPIFNIINGGAHAKIKSLEFQEFQIIPSTKDYAIGLSVAQEFYKKLGRFLEEKFGKEKVLLGDEAGFSCPFNSNEEALDTIYELIQKNKYPLNIGMDIAASQFFVKERYLANGKEYSPQEMAGFYKDIINRYGIISIEDPFYEESFGVFTALTSEVGGSVLVITDDLTATNKERLQKAIEEKSGNAILIKLNQIGTLSETLEVVALAYQNNWKCVVSHRSGETMDDFIADLAVGIGAWGIKAGAPAKPERMAKYNRLLEIQQKGLKM